MVGSLLGVIIGCILTWISNIITDSQKFKREKDFYFLKKKEETYVEMCDVVTELYACSKDLKGTKVFPINLRLKYNSIKVKAEMYADKDVTEAFYDFANNDFVESCLFNGNDISLEKFNKVFELSKKSLGVK